MVDAIILAMVLAISVVVGGRALITSKRDAVAILSLFVGVTFVFPAVMVFPGLGAAGTPSAVVGIALLVWWLVSWATPQGWDRGWQPMRTTALVFAATMLLGYAVAHSRWLTGEETRAADRGLIGLAVFVGVILVATDGIDTRERLDTLLRRLVGFATFAALVGIGQHIVGIDAVEWILRTPGLVQNYDAYSIVARGSVTRVASTAGHPIEFGVVLALVLPVALHYARAARPEARTLAWTQTLVIALAIPLSVSRSGVVALVVAFVVLMAAWDARTRINFLVGTVLYLGLARAIAPGVLGTLRNLFTADEEDSVAARTDDIDLVFDYFGQAPVLGRGFRTFVSSQYTVLDNEYFAFLIETGVVGVASLLALFVVGMALARGTARTTADADTRSLGFTLLASIAASAVTFATFDAFFFRLNAAVLAILLGTAGALWRLERRDAPQRRRRVTASGVPTGHPRFAR